MTKKQKTSTAMLICQRFGGAAKLARAVDAEYSTVLSWMHRDRIPQTWFARILEAAQRLEISLDAHDLIYGERR